MRVMDQGAQTETITEQAVLSALATIQDPDLRRDIVSLGFVKGLRIDGGTVAFAIELTMPACLVRDQMKEQRWKDGHDSLYTGYALRLACGCAQLRHPAVAHPACRA